jgi:hypothetical protein
MSDRDRQSLEVKAELHARKRKALAEAFPNLDPEDEAFVGTLEGETDFYEAVDAKVELLRRDLAEAAGLRLQAETYTAPLLERAARLEARAESIKARLTRVLQEVGEERINRPAYGLTVRKNGNPAVIITERALLPANYLTFKPVPPPEPNKAAIREALNDPKRRAEVERAATLANAAPTLQIKLK